MAAGANPILVTNPHPAAKHIDPAKVVSVDDAPGVHEAWADMFGADTLASAVVQEGDEPAAVVLASTDTETDPAEDVVGPELRSPSSGNVPIAVDADGRPIIRLDGLDPGDDGDSNGKRRKSKVRRGGLAAAVIAQQERDRERLKERQYKGMPLFSLEMADGEYSTASVHLDLRGAEPALSITLSRVTGPGEFGAETLPRTFRMGPDRRIAGSDGSTLGEVDERGQFTFDPDSLVAEAEQMRSDRPRSAKGVIGDFVWDVLGWRRRVKYLGRGRWEVTDPDRDRRAIRGGRRRGHGTARRRHHPRRRHSGRL